MVLCYTLVVSPTVLCFVHCFQFLTNILQNAGISMTVEQWEAFRNAVPAIEDAIKKLEDSD